MRALGLWAFIHCVCAMFSTLNTLPNCDSPQCLQPRPDLRSPTPAAVGTCLRPFWGALLCNRALGAPLTISLRYVPRHESAESKCRSRFRSWVLLVGKQVSRKAVPRSCPLGGAEGCRQGPGCLPTPLLPWSWVFTDYTPHGLR